MKKILVVLTVLCMMAGMAAAETSGDWEYQTRWGSDTVYITKYNGTAESVVIPTELDGKAVGAIGDGNKSPFKDCTDLLSVEIPEGFTMVNYYAFNSCASIKTIILPSTIETIGFHAFQNCTSLESITLPDGLVSIGSSAFIDCSSLKSIIIPKNITSIEDQTFKGCIELSSIVIPKGLTSIGRDAFYNCSSLMDIEIPNSVASMGSGVFRNCSSLTSIMIPNGVTEIGDYAFDGCRSLEEVSIPDEVTSIGELAFQNCSKLTSIVIPEGVTDIGRQVFSGCTNLTGITIPDGVTNIGYDAFYNCKSLTEIEIPLTLKTMGSNAFYGCKILKSITLPDDMTNIGNGDVGVVCYCHIGSQTAQLLGIASSGNKFCDPDYPGLYFLYDYDQDEKVITGLSLKDADETITTAVIPSGVTKIGSQAFYNCKKLSNVEIPDTVTSLEYTAFGNCKVLSDLELPSTLKTMGYGVFSGCESLKSVTLPDDMTSIDGDVGVVSNCHIGSQTAKLLGIASSWSNLFCDENYPGLYFSYVYDQDEKIITGLKLRDADEAIVTAQIPAEVTTIGDNAFSDCSSLASVMIPNGVTSIEQGAFYNCTSLSSVLIPDSVTSIGNTAFGSCKKLTQVVLPQTLNTIGSYVFSGCTSLMSYTLSDNITDVGEYVHDESTTVCFCTLGSPASYALSKGGSTFADPAYDKLVLRYIYDKDTASFTGLELVRAQEDIAEAVLPDGVTLINHGALSNLQNLTSVMIPDSVTTIEGNAFLKSPKLLSVTLPDHVTSIGNYIIEREKTIYCSVDSDTARALNAGDSSAMFMDPLYPDYWLSYKHDGDTITGPVLSKAATHLITAVIPDFVTDIGDYAFSDCTKVRSIRFPDGLKIIGKGAFSRCEGLSEISIPNGVTSIGQYAFNSAGKTKVYIPTTVNMIGDHAFNAVRTTIYCYQYSYAQSWGNQNKVTVVLLDGKDFKSAGGTVSMPQTLYVGNGRSKTIAAEIFPKMSGLNITWKSSNTDVATVSSQGVLTAKKNGKTTVTLSVDGITARSAVTVVTPAEDFTIPADVFVEAGKATDAPAPVVYPSNAKLDLTWEVADTVIAEVSGDGKITSHVVGETTITATDSVTGLRRSATLHTIRPVTSIVLQPATLTLLPYQGAQLSAIVSADAFQFENQLVTFTSSNKKVATVDENGWVQAKGAGTAVITAVSENNIRATSQVTVSKATVLKLPSALRTIQANAFSGIAAEVVVLPTGVESIGDGAFANLSGLKLVVVPEAAAQAAKDAFAGTQAVLVRPDGREINPQ